MGLDFIRRASKGFTKAWNRSKAELSQPTLFTQYPECRTRSVIADLDERAKLSEGTHIVVCVQGSKLILVQEKSRVGVVEHPPADLLGSIHQAGDCALGHVVRINPLSGTADVEIE